MTPYVDELRVHWRPLVAAFLGMSCGLTVCGYIIGIISPYMLKDLGWARADFALVTGLGIASAVMYPIAGRVTDRIGVRPVAAAGAVLSPLVFVGMSQVHSLGAYAVWFAMQCGLLVTTTAPIYCRVVVQHITRARGLALALVTSGPALTTAVGGPVLNNFIVAHGWRAGYLALAVAAAIAGAVAIWLLPASGGKGATPRVERRATRGDYAKIFRMPAFWIMVAAVLLGTLPQSVIATQISLVLAEHGVSGRAASAIISSYAGGMLVGRFVCGLALDRFPSPIVSAAGFILAAIGVFILASSIDARPMLMLAAGLFGLTCGAEGDIIAYLVMRNFGLRIYSSVAGVLGMIVTLSAVLAAVTVSLMLKHFGGYAAFLTLSGVVVVIASGLFLLLPANPPAPDEGDEPAAEEARRRLAPQTGAAAVPRTAI